MISTNPVAYQHWPKNKPVQSRGQCRTAAAEFRRPAAQRRAGGGRKPGGYSINQVTVAKSSQPSGTIIRQSPAANTPITPGEVVTVWVSAGPPVVSVPDVTGEDIHKAEADLSAAGFNVTVNQIGPGHRVITYSPTGTAPQGSTITITVGFGF